MHEKDVIINGTRWFYAGKIEGREIFRNTSELSTAENPGKYFHLTNGKMRESKRVLHIVQYGWA